jgi:hypothetical protein
MPAIPFTDPRRCDGVRFAINLKPREVCVSCPLRINAIPRDVQWIEALAKPDADGVWGCATREALHAAHRPTLAALCRPLTYEGPQAGSYVRQGTEGRA